MAAACCTRDYKCAEKAFIQDYYANRVFQNAKEDGKVICNECYHNDGKISFFTSAGVKVHYRRTHKPKTFQQDTSSKLFHEMYFNETKGFIEQLSSFRATNHTNCTTLKEYAEKAEK